MSVSDKDPSFASTTNRSPVVAGVDQAADASREGVHTRNRGAGCNLPYIGTGEVLRVVPGLQSVEVKLAELGHPLITCYVVGAACAHDQGAAITALPCPGDIVLVSTIGDTGYVLGVVPPHSVVGMRADIPQPVNNFLAPQAQAKPASEPMAVTLTTDPKVPLRPAAAGRYQDQWPGGWSALVSGLKTGFSLAGHTATMHGGERAQVAVSKLQNAVTIRSDLYQNQHAGGETVIYDDHGFMTGVYNMCTNLTDRIGGIKCVPVLEELKSLREKPAATISQKLLDSVLELSSKPSLRAFVGYVGGVFRAFVGKSESEAKTDPTDAKEGVLDIHTGKDGRVTVRSKAGFSFQCVENIPFPQDLKQPWDPEGSDPAKPETGFEDKTGEYAYIDPKSKALELRSAEAWRGAIADSAMRGPLKKDYEFAEPSLKKPEQVKNAVKTSYLNMEPDGSIIIRGGYGEELIMANGKITMSAPLGVMVASAQGVQVLAGDDLILKAKKSIDISATDNDIRVKAENNLHMVAASPSRGNILLESLAYGSGVSDDATLKGEAYVGRGVVTKAQNSQAVTTAATTVVHGNQTCRVSGDSEAIVIAPEIVCSGTNKIQLESAGLVKKEDSETPSSKKPFVRYGMLQLVPTGCQLYGGSVGIYTNGGVMMTQKANMAEIKWNTPARGSSLVNVYEDFGDEFIVDYTERQTATADFSNVLFTFRVNADYGTDATTKVMDAPAWAHMLRTEELEINGYQLAVWKERKLDRNVSDDDYEANAAADLEDDTPTDDDEAAKTAEAEETEEEKEGEYPWPGRDVYRAGGKGYRKLLKEKNVVTIKPETPTEDPTLNIKLVATPDLWENLSNTQPDAEAEAEDSKADLCFNQFLIIRAKDEETVED